MKIKKFENIDFDDEFDWEEDDPDKKIEIRVKHIIEYLQRFDPENLNKDGWDGGYD